MQGWKIIAHSARMIFNNWQAVLRISGLLFVLQIVAVFATVVLTAMIGSSFVFLLFLPIYLILFFWIAVGWHRFVLTGEISGALLPKFRGNLILAYFNKSFAILLIFMVPLIAANYVFGSLNIILFRAGIPLTIGGMSITSIVSIIGLVFVFYRLSPVLPAAALGYDLRMREAWTLTKRASRAILIVLVATSLVGVAPYLLPQEATILTTIIFCILNWIGMIFGISIITTLYGHYAEGRDLD